MNPYYTANTIFVVLSMMIMLTAVSFNTTLDQQRKNITRVLFLVISTAALCEWLGNALDGAPAESIGLHKLVKYVELCSAPYLGLLCGKSLSNHILWEKGIRCLLAFHVMLETVTLFTGQIWYVDAQNIYRHGPLYAVYIAFYCFSAVLSGAGAADLPALPAERQRDGAAGHGLSGQRHRGDAVR